MMRNSKANCATQLDAALTPSVRVCEGPIGNDH